MTADVDGDELEERLWKAIRDVRDHEYTQGLRLSPILGYQRNVYAIDKALADGIISPEEAQFLESRL